MNSICCTQSKNFHLLLPLIVYCFRCSSSLKTFYLFFFFFFFLLPLLLPPPPPELVEDCSLLLLFVLPPLAALAPEDTLGLCDEDPADRVRDAPGTGAYSQPNTENLGRFDLMASTSCNRGT